MVEFIVVYGWYKVILRAGVGGGQGRAGGLSSE